jgi:hypothetical protein
MTTPLTREAFINLLNTNDRAVERALLVLLARQERVEQEAETTKFRNDRGFTQADARIMTSMAKQVQRGHRLTERQLAFLRNRKTDGRFPGRIQKYTRQLLEEAKQRVIAELKATQMINAVREDLEREHRRMQAVNNGELAV